MNYTMIKRFFILLLAIVASVGMSFAQAGVVSSGTKGGMSYTFYDNGLLEISGSGALPGQAFTNWDGGFGTSVKNIRFAEDCEVYGLDYLWFGCYTEKSQLETIEINSVAPIMFSGSSGAGIFYQQDGAVTITITAPGIVDAENQIIDNYGSPVNMIFNLPATTVFEKKWFSGLENNFAVTIPTGAKGHVPGGYSFKDPYDQKDYEMFVSMGKEAQFWEMYSHLEEGKDYTFGVESTFEITAENASQIFGQAAVSFQAPTEASNSEWVLWRKSDLKEFSDMSSGDQKVCKDVTVKVNNGVYNTDSGWGIHFESLGEDGVQFVAPEGKVFKRIVILNEYGTFSDPNWSYDKNYKKWSGSANTVGFVGNICGISLIEFELEASAPANQLYMEVDGTAGTLKWGLAGSNPVYDGNAIQYSDRKYITTLTIDASCQNHTLTSFYNLFYVFSGLTTINGLENLATANVESMRYMFYDCKALTSLDLSSFNTAKVTDMKGMFNGCSNLTTIYVGDGWNTSAVTNGSAMFYGCTNLPNYDSEATGVDKAYVGAGGYLSANLTPADVMALISAIGTVEYTAESKAKIDAARTAYDALSTEDQALVTNIATLTQAETDYANAKQAADQAAAAPVIAKINALPNPVTAADTKLSVYTNVQDARAAYDALTDDQKALVSNIANLTAAEEAFNALPPVGSETVITWDKNTGIEEIGTHTTSPAYEGITLSTKGGMFGPNGDMLRFYISISDICFEFANTLGANFSKIVLSSTSAIPSTRLNDMGEGWVASNDNKIATWTGDAETVKIWNGITATSFWDVNTLQFTLGSSVSPIVAAQAAVALINAIPDPVTLDEACVKAIKDAREAVTALGEASSLIDAADMTKLTKAEAAYTALIQAGADAVKAKIAAIPQPVTLKLATRDAIESARAAYDALTDDQKALVTNYAVLEAAEAALAALNPGGGAPAGALNGKFTINAGGDQIAFAKGNLQATTTDLGAHWTWGFAANQWNYLGIAVANNKITGNKTVSENGTVDLFGWSTNATYYGINNSYKAVDYIGDFVDWGPNMGAGWRTLTKDEWAYLLQHSSNGKATVNDKNGYIFLPDNWSGPAFTPNPDNFTTNVYSGDDWTAMENAGAVFLPSGPARNGTYALIAMDARYCSSTSLNNDSSYVFTIYYNQSQSACTGTNRAYGCMVRLVSEGGGATPLDSAQAVKDLIEAIPAEITLDAACVNAVQAARDAYNALSDAAKGALDAATGQKLTDAEQALKDLNQAVADEVIAKINNIPTPVELKLATRDSIESARAAYDALTAEQKALVPADVLKKLTDAEDALADLVPTPTPVPVTPTVWDMNELKVGDIIYEGDQLTIMSSPRYINNEVIRENKCPYTLMKSAGETSYVLKDKDGSYLFTDGSLAITPTSVGLLVTSVKSGDINVVVYSLANVLDSAQIVKDLIDAIPTPVEYPTSGLAIAAALVAYQQLSDAAKGALDAADVQKMTDAATQYTALDAIAAIEAIPAEIVYDPAVKAAIETAREKYDALIDASKALVDAEVVAKLTNAEQAWADLVALIEHNVSYIGKDGELKNEKVALLNIPNPAPDFNGHEFVRWDVKAGDFLEEGLRVKAVYTPIITTDPVAYDTLVYNGTAQELVAAGVAKEGHIEYRIGEGAWSADLPKADMAAAYVVDYKLVREGHEDYMAGSVTAVISKAPVTYVAPQAYDTLAYNYNTQVLVTAGQTNDGTIEYSLDPNLLDSWSADLPQAMNAGTYAVNYRVIGDANHFDSIVPAPVTVTIAKRDIEVTAPVAYDTLVYNALAQTLAAAGSADFSTMEYTLTPDNGEGWSADMPQAMNAGTYTIYYRVQGDNNHNDYPAHSIAATIAQAPLTITAENKEVIYGDAAPEFTATYSGWQGQDDASVVSDLKISSDYAVGSSVGTYAIVPGEASALNYAMSYINGTLTVNKAKVSVINAEAQKAKFADGHAVAVVLNQGTLDGVKLNDAVTHVTTAAFSSAEVAENLTITLFYELQGDEALLANYLLEPTSEIFSEEGVIIEPFLPDNEGKPEDEEAKIQEGIEVYAYGYCTGTGYSLNYHLNSGNPDQYKIEFEDSRFDDVAYEETKIASSDGHIDIEIPDGLPTGDYKMSVTFRDSRFPWLESKAFDVTFHVNLPETYVKPLFNNTIILVDTCECMTDIQWYHRADATKTWQPVAGATGHYLHVDGQLTGEYFVAAKMNGVPTYTCGQEDMQTLYGADNNRQAKVRAYPNPVVNTTTVSIENSDSYEHNLRIVNLMGIEVMNTTFEGDDTVVNMDGYVTGNYTISVDGIAVKVLKQ